MCSRQRTCQKKRNTWQTVWNTNFTWKGSSQFPEISQLFWHGICSALEYGQEIARVITTVLFLTTYCDDPPSMMIYQSEPPEFVCENCMTVSQEYLMDYHVGFVRKSGTSKSQWIFSIITFPWPTGGLNSQTDKPFSEDPDTSQHGVVWLVFYVSWPAAAAFFLLLLLLLLLLRTSTASSRLQCSPPDLHHKLRIRVFPAGLPPQAPDQSVPRRTSTASSGSECSPPDLHRKLRIKVFPAGPPPQSQDQSVPRRTSTASSGSKCSPPDLHRKLRIKVFPAGPPPQRISGDIPDRMPDRMSEKMWDKMWMPDRMSENMISQCSTCLMGIPWYTPFSDRL